jgi:hypothetical protein
MQASPILLLLCRQEGRLRQGSDGLMPRTTGMDTIGGHKRAGGRGERHEQIDDLGFIEFRYRANPIVEAAVQYRSWLSFE